MNSFKAIFEASYSGNIGFEEMVKFYQKASPKETKQIQKIINNEDWEGYKKIIMNVLGVKLK